MNFEEALREELGALPGIAGKVFPLNAPEGTAAPYLVYLSSEGSFDRSLDGFLSSKEIPCELNVVHSSYSGMKAITGSVLPKLMSFLGRNIGNGGPFIQDISYEDPVELYENEVGLYRCMISIQVRL